ncbi:tudor domain-containing protein 3-like isoform X2 [Ornithodoros turicata]|uniref:tudor domain-containing protein 3-like isoform X2 n=1 Tax=Ornithodoros turicata TaxID=34597 RepID=UPI003139D85A
MDLNAELRTRGWYLSSDGLEECTEGLDKPRADEVIRKALDLDLTEISEGGLPEDVVRNRVDTVSGPVVVQVQKVRNVSAPKSNPESEFAPKLLRLQITDGSSYCSALQWEKWHSISLSTPPGSKILLKSTSIPVVNGFLLLSEKDIKFLGGRVAHLIEKWEVAKNLSHHSRIVGQEGNAPPWVPFGQKIDTGSLKDMKGNFKSMDQCQKDTKPNEAFEKHRQMTIAEVSRAKEGKVKVFGGVKQPQDGDIAQLVGFGCTVDEAVNALRLNNCDLASAIHSLEKSSNNNRKDRAGGRPENNRKKREHRERDSGEDKAPSRPSAPSTLFDFLQNQISLPKVPEIEDAHVMNSYETRRGGDTSDRYRRPERQQRDPQDYNSAKQGQQRNREYGGRRNEGNVPYQNSGGSGTQTSHRNNTGYQNDGNTFQGRQQRPFPNHRDSKPSSGDYHSTIPPRLQHVQAARQDGRSYYGGEGDRKRTSRTDENQQSQQQPQQAWQSLQEAALQNDVADAKDTKQPQKRLTSGQKVLAKYWEDGKFYRSIVHEVSSNGNTCVVKFVDYGNHEEVLCSDVQTVTLAQWEHGYVNAGKPGYHQQQHPHPNGRQFNHDFRYDSSGDAVNQHGGDSLHGNYAREFRPQHGNRPQGGRGRQGSNQQPGRPAQRYYQPPAQRRNVPS